MKIEIPLLIAVLALAGCQTATKEAAKPAPPPLEPSLPPVTVTDLDPRNVENVRVGETLKAYPLGRYIDPSDPNVMHEAHTIYRREAAANWNLNPNAPTVIPLGPVLAVADPVRAPNPLPAELEQKLGEQNKLMVALIEQNEALAAELAKLNREMAELRGKQSARAVPASATTEEKK